MKAINLDRPWVLPLLYILFLLSLLLHLGVQPVFLEEPRRALIAMEMIENGNYVVPTQMGDFYYKKPPVFNWLLVASAQLFGGFTPWALRLPTVLSLLLTCLLLYRLGSHYVSPRFGRLLPLLFATSGGIYFYFSLLGEIDLFYTLVTVACLWSIFHFQQQGQWAWLFVISYFLAAVGTLTKGLPSIPFLGITLVGWLWWCGEWRRLFTWQHLLGVLVFSAVLGSYAWAYHVHNPISHYIAALFAESVERTAVENSTTRFLLHLLTFPIDTLKDSLPGCLLLLFWFRPGTRSLLRQSPLLQFAVLAFVLNFVLYWLSPGARQRYIYMLYPFLHILGLYAYLHRSSTPVWPMKTFQWIVTLAILVVGVGCLMIPFLPAFDFLVYRWELGAGAAIGFAIVGLVYWRNPQRPLLILLLAAVAFRLVFDLCIPQQRAHAGSGQADLAKAEEIHQIVQKNNLYAYPRSRFSYTTVYYLNRKRGETLRYDSIFQTDSYYIIADTLLPDLHPLTTMRYDTIDFKLVRYRE